MRLATADAAALACPPLTSCGNIAGFESVNLDIFHLKFTHSYESGTGKLTQLFTMGDVQAPTCCKGFNQNRKWVLFFMTSRKFCKKILRQFGLELGQEGVSVVAMAFNISKGIASR